MNTLDAYINPLEEREICENIYEVLAHIAIFKPLLSCVFPEFIIQSVNGTNIFPDQKAWREDFLKDENNIEKIINYFRQEENIYKFSNEVEKFYILHKEALDKVWINYFHKNTYSIAVATIRAITLQKTNEHKFNFTSMKLDQTTIKKQVEAKFREILESQKEYDIAWDIEWNLFDWNNANIKNFFGKRIAKINWKFIDPDTRKEVLIEWCKIISLYRTVELLNWEKVKRAKILDNDWIEKILYITKDNKFFRIEWERVTEVYSNRCWLREIWELPSWIELLNISLENKWTRYITNENKIFKIEWNEQFYLFDKKSSLLLWSELERITKTRKLSKIQINWCENFLFITEKNNIFRIEFEWKTHEPFILEERFNRKHRGKLFHWEAKWLKFIITRNWIEKAE